MNNEKIAALALVIIIAGALSVYLGVTYGEDVFKNLFGNGDTTETNAIELGDCVDVNYIGRYASNGTVFDTSYSDLENKTGGTPLNIFVSLNASEMPPVGYETYTSGMIKGFMEGLIGLEEVENVTIGPIPPEDAYGVYPKIGDIINLTEIYGTTTSAVYEISSIQENVSMPDDFESNYGNITTSLYVLKEAWHYIGEIVELSYPSWNNSSVVTRINETLMWMEITPSTDLGENFTWTEVDANTGIQNTFPENASSITNMTNDTIVVTHNLKINDTIEVASMFGSMSYTVENLTDDKINTSYVIDAGGNKSYVEFDRTITIQRNQTQNITYPAFPGEFLEEQLFSYLRIYTSDFSLGFSDLAGETLNFEVEIVVVYKTS
jgi:FKBP-type peptidyl-prolyl cis-trans isomerase 2